MIAERDIIKVEIPKDHFALVKKYAKKVEFGGRSSVYSDYAERMGKLEENQLVGQMGEYAACVALFDFEKYVEKQEQIVEKGQGDYGTDIPGAQIPIDVKTSNVKVDGEKWGTVFFKRNLIVSNFEYNPNVIYVGAVVLDTPSHDDETGTVYLMGWTYGRKMEYQKWFEWTSQKEKDGFRRKYGYLKKLSEMSWKYLLEKPSEAPVLASAAS